MNNEDLLYIEDEQQRKLFYRFTPAKLVSNFVPLVVILDTETTHFEYKMWNVLTPLDTLAYEKRDLVQKLIRQIADEYECEDHIYLCGNSIGGYEAILHGILCNANAVYVDSPHIRSVKTDNTVSKENDLSNLLNTNDSFPIFYLCDTKDATPSTEKSSLENQIAYFVNACKKHDIDVYTDFCPNLEDNESHTLKKVLNMFERVTS